MFKQLLHYLFYSLTFHPIFPTTLPQSYIKDFFIAMILGRIARLLSDLAKKGCPSGTKNESLEYV